jgi:hypothetical protein
VGQARDGCSLLGEKLLSVGPARRGAGRDQPGEAMEACLQLTVVVENRHFTIALVEKKKL